MSKAPVQDAILVGICKLWRGWDGGVMCRDTLSLVGSDNDVRIVSLDFNVVLAPCSLLWGDILHAERNASLNNFVHHLDREVDMNVINWQVCLAQIQVACNDMTTVCMRAREFLVGSSLGVGPSFLPSSLALKAGLPPTSAKGSHARAHSHAASTP